ncbi:MAG: aminomethyl-transferring glycine dehydrogenase subunit GcvPA [Aquificaceae bacterium]|nr:MAG: aminomethyl-transferring glycine dehydrogenase subunit GcvPA [Aquificaceae bacterium]
MAYIPHSPDETQEMLSLIGAKSFEDLYSHIDERLLFKGELNLPQPLSEAEILQTFKGLAEKNKQLKIFAGAGAYDRYIPSAVDYLAERGEFLTAYTPYQPEVSQGTLTAIFEYQTVIAELTGMDVANASMYDGSSALAEAVLMARAIKGKGDTVVLSSAIHPLYLQVVKTYLYGYRDKVVEIPFTEEGVTDLNKLQEVLKREDVHALAIQYPNFFGFVEPLKEIGELAQKYGVPLIVVSDPIALAVLKPPALFGADIVVGEGQQLGNPLYFGGPYLGFFATRQKYVRKMPGRLVGMGEDIEGKRAFTLVLQTREQHIRRERATSNICSNQNLLALRALIYIALLGKEGLKEVAKQSVAKARYLYRGLTSLGWENPFKNEQFLWEFPIKHPDAQALRKKLLKEGFMFGIDLGRFYPDMENTLLVAVTEKRTKGEMDKLLSLLKLQ